MNPVPPSSPPSSRRHGGFLHVTLMLAGMTAARLFGMAANFLVANLLGPALFGVWGTLRLIFTYGTINHLGVLEAYRKETPRHRGAGREELSLEVESLSYAAAWLASGLSLFLGTLVLLVFVVLSPDSVPAEYAHPSFWVLVAVAAATLGTLFFDRFTVRHLFEEASLLRGARGLAYLLFMPAGTLIGGMWGLCLGFAASEWAVTLYSIWLGRGKCPPLRPRFDAPQLWNLVKIGFPITLVWWTYLVGTTFDRIVCMTFLGKEPTGLYFMGITLASGLQMMPEALSRVVNPRLHERMGETADPAEVARLVWEPAKSLSWMLPLAFGSLVFFIEPAFALAFPKYLPGVRSAQILVIATSLVALIPLGTDYLVSIHQQKRLLLITPFSLLFNLIANITLVQLHFGIAGVAFVTMLTNGLVAGYLWKRVTVHLPNGGGMQDLFSLFMGFLVCNLVVWPLEVGLSAFGFAGWPGAGLKAGLFAVVYLAALGWFLSTREWVRMDLRRLARMRAQAMDSTKV